MDNVSKPLVALLIATVAFFALWTVALRPSGHSATSHGTTVYKGAIDAAHHAVGVAAKASSAAGGAGPGQTATAAPHQSAIGQSATGQTAAAGPLEPRPPVQRPAPASERQITKAPSHLVATVPATQTTAGTVAKPAQSRAPAAVSGPRADAVTRALTGHRVVALLFYNPAAADDRAVKREMGLIPTHGGQVVKLAVPISELADYPAVTNQVPINQSPTLVLVNRRRQATTIVGFSDAFEIAQRVVDALAVK